MLNINFNHSEDNISSAIRLSENDIDYIKKVLIFSILSPKILSEMLFDNDDEIPNNMKTTTGAIEQGLTLLKNDNMIFYYLFNFYEFNKKISEKYAIYKYEDKAMDMFEGEGIEKTIKQLILQLEIESSKRLFKIIEDSKGDFDKFSNMFDKLTINTEM
jgi:hypothetical protein